MRIRTAASPSPVADPPHLAAPRCVLPPPCPPPSISVRPTTRHSRSHACERSCGPIGRDVVPPYETGPWIVDPARRDAARATMDQRRWTGPEGASLGGQHVIFLVSFISPAFRQLQTLTCWLVWVWDFVAFGLYEVLIENGDGYEVANE